MQSMQERRVVGGVDAHVDTHHAAVLDERGGLLATQAFATTSAGYRALLCWLRSFGQLERIGVESTGSYAAGLTRYLLGEDVVVVEVNQPHPHARHRRGKTDAIDAELAARFALSGRGRVVPKRTDGIVESIRMLRVARDGATKARVAALLQLGDLVITAPSELREQLAKTPSTTARCALCRRLRPDEGHLADTTNAAKAALRSLARRIGQLEEEIKELDEQLTPLVERAAPSTLARFGVGPNHAGQLLVSAGQNIERLRNEGAFAALCGVSPTPVASGKSARYRLNRGGDRQANRALHMIAICRMRYCPRTRAYVERRTAEGMTKREIIRCLKRYIAREIHHTLTTDLAALQTT